MCNNFGCKYRNLNGTCTVTACYMADSQTTYSTGTYRNTDFIQGCSIRTDPKVFCSECIYFIPDGYGCVCGMGLENVTPHDFCSRGIRITNAELRSTNG